MKRLLACSLLTLAIACGGDDAPVEKRDAVEVLEPLAPVDAAREAKLSLDAYYDFAYCDKQYPQVCSAAEKQVYVLPREEDSESLRLVFSNNQDPYSTWAVFDYVTMSVYGGDVTEVGHFEWRIDPDPEVGRQTSGEPLWGVPDLAAAPAF